MSGTDTASRRPAGGRSPASPTTGRARSTTPQTCRTQEPASRARRATKSHDASVPSSRREQVTWWACVAAGLKAREAVRGRRDRSPLSMARSGRGSGTTTPARLLFFAMCNKGRAGASGRGTADQEFDRHGAERQPPRPVGHPPSDIRRRICAGSVDLQQKHLDAFAAAAIIGAGGRAGGAAGAGAGWRRARGECYESGSGSGRRRAPEECCESESESIDGNGSRRWAPEGGRSLYPRLRKRRLLLRRATNSGLHVGAGEQPGRRGDRAAAELRGEGGTAAHVTGSPPSPDGGQALVRVEWLVRPEAEDVASAPRHPKCQPRRAIASSLQEMLSSVIYISNGQSIRCHEIRILPTITRPNTPLLNCSERDVLNAAELRISIDQADQQDSQESNQAYKRLPNLSTLRKRDQAGDPVLVSSGHANGRFPTDCQPLDAMISAKLLQKDWGANVMTHAERWALAERLLIPELQRMTMDGPRPLVGMAGSENWSTLRHSAYESSLEQTVLDLLAAGRLAWIISFLALQVWMTGRHLPEGVVGDVLMGLKKHHVHGLELTRNFGGNVHAVTVTRLLLGTTGEPEPGCRGRPADSKTHEHTRNLANLRKSTLAAYARRKAVEIKEQWIAKTTSA
ncbi:unnamed protein product [Diplocarpon coronariae]